MNKKVLYTILPALLLTSCQGSTQGQNTNTSVIVTVASTTPVTPTPTPIPVYTCSDCSGKTWKSNTPCPIVDCKSPTPSPTAKVVEFSSVITLSGTGDKGYQDGSQKVARFSSPFSVAVDKGGNVFVSEIDNSTIRRIDPNGETSTFAGTPGKKGFADGQSGAALFNEPNGLVFDKYDNLYVADSRNYRIRKITPQGNVTTIAGTGEAGFADGEALKAKFDDPMGMIFDNDGNLYIVDEANHRVRKLDTNGKVTTFAGTGIKGNADGKSNEAQFNSPSCIIRDSKGNLYIAEFNHVIRKIDTNGNVTTFAGSRIAGLVDSKGPVAQFNFPQGLAVDEVDNIYVGDSVNNRIRRIDPDGNVTTIAGSGEGFFDSLPIASKFRNPAGIAFDSSGNLYVADVFNNALRKLQRK